MKEKQRNVLCPDYCTLALVLFWFIDPLLVPVLDVMILHVPFFSGSSLMVLDGPFFSSLGPHVVCNEKSVLSVEVSLHFL